METLHFSIGEEFGLMITNVAQEKIICNQGGITKALDVLDTTLPNSSYKFLMDVLEGRKVIEVNIDSQEMVVVDYDSEKHSEYRQFNAQKYEDTLKGYLNELQKQTGESIESFQEMVEDLTQKDYLLYETEKRLKYLEEETGVKFQYNIDGTVANKLSETYFSKSVGGNLLDSYLSANKEIDEKLNVDEYLPNDILDLDNAGWLAPNGDWYGLNGTLANMLHNQIADTLFEKGIIKSDEHKGNPDQILNQEGWMRIHNGWILYDGYYYDKRVTKEQKKAVYDYGFKLQNTGGRLKLGLNQTPISAGQWSAIEPLQLKLKWFKI